MTQIGHVVIGLIIVVAAIYLIIFVSQRLTARKVNKLIQKKAQLAEIPMRDRLVKGRQLSLTGQSLKQFQLLEAKYNHLETSEFNNIDLKANTVLFDSQGLNFLKTAQGMKSLQQQIRDAETIIDVVNQGLSDLEQLDAAHKQAVKDLESKYQELRKVLLSQNFAFGPAIDKLEEILGSLEDDFAEFAPTLASSPSSSSPTEAPVYKLILIFSPSFTLFASAMGTDLGYPENVKPLVPTVMPSFISSAASLGVPMHFRSSLFFILSVIILSPSLLNN